MITILLIILFNALVIQGIHQAFYYTVKDSYFTSKKLSDINEDSKNIFWYANWWLEQRIGFFWTKPLFNCPKCMASLHSIYIYFPAAFFHYNLTFVQAIVFYPFYVCAVSGTSYFINK